MPTILSLILRSKVNVKYVHIYSTYIELERYDTKDVKLALNLTRSFQVVDNFIYSKVRSQGQR